MQIKWNSETQPKMNVNIAGQVVYLTYPSIENLHMVKHGFTTRLGGVSRGFLSSMNLSFTRGDEESAVYENYRRIGSAIGFNYEDIATSDQTHTTNVRVVTEEDKGNGITRPRPYSDVDGLVTNVPGVILATFYADCVPLYFVDPVRKAVGLSHSGWRGTAGKIGKVTVERMHQEYGTDPGDIVAAIGPSICQECYEVSEDVAEEFRNVFSRQAWPELYYKKINGKYQLNLWRANELILEEAGIRRENISLPNLCTCCNPEVLYSHRASHGKRGNLAAFLGLCE